MFALHKIMGSAALAAGLTFVGVSSASAYATNPFALTIVTSPSNSNGTGTGWSFVATIPQFNFGLPSVNADCLTGDTCTLTSVVVTVSDTTGGNIVFTGGPSGSTLGTAASPYSVGSEVDYNNPFTNDPNTGGATIGAALLCNPSQVSLVSGSNSVACTGAGNDKLIFSANQIITATLLHPATSNEPYTSSDPSVLSNIQAGTLSFDGLTDSYGEGAFSNNTSQAPNVTSSVSGTVVFDYTDTPPVVPTPEPASIAVIAIGLIGVGSARRLLRKG